MKKHREGHPIYEGMPELTDDGKPGFDWCFAAIVTVIGICAGAALVLFVQILLTTPARAEGPVAQPSPMRLQVLCMDIEVMESILDADLGQRLAQMGTRLSGEQVLLFLNPDTRSFTLGFLRESDGLFCGLGAGEQWDMPGLTATRGEGL